MIDVMLDLETMSSSSTAAIIAIGAVAFDRHGQLPDPLVTSTGRIGKSNPVPMFYTNIELSSAINAGLTVDGATVEWWLTQSEAARAALRDPAPIDLWMALNRFTIWLAELVGIGVAAWSSFELADQVRKSKKPLYLWSHATFDAPILANAYAAVGRPFPFSYRAARDVRTIYDLAYGGAEVPGLPDYLKHDALADAYRQAVGVQICQRELDRRGLLVTSEWESPE